MKYFREIDVELPRYVQAVAISKRPRPVDPVLKALQDNLAVAKRPVPLDPELRQLRLDVKMSGQQLADARLTAVQDLTWALINSPSFLFNR